MFCQCYFNPTPAGHGGHGEHADTGEHGGGDATHFCRFNMAFKIDEGHSGGDERAFEFSGSNGFMITVTADSGG